MAILAHPRSIIRGLLRAPTFTLTIVLTVGVAIASNAAIFGVVDALLVRPLPYPDSNRLVGVWHTAPGVDVPQFQQADGTYLIYRDRNRVFEDIGIYRTLPVNISDGTSPEEVPAAQVTPSVLSLLGVAPRVGRGFVEEEGRPGAEPTVVLSHGLWAGRFGSAPDVIGKTLRVEGAPHTIIGVMPPGFSFPESQTRLWLPLEIDPTKADTGNFLYTGVARLRPGIDITQAASDISSLVKILPTEAANPHLGAEMIEQMRMAALVIPLKEEVVGEISGTLQILFASVGVILLIACANIANLFLVRAEGRHKELAVRSALGASRARLVLTLLAESTLLAIAGGAIGLGLAKIGIEAFRSSQAGEIPRLEEVVIGGRVVAFTFLLSVLSGLLFGAMTALRSPADLATSLKEGGAATSGSSRQRARHALVVAQVALAFVLLTGTGLTAKSLRELAIVNPGFDAGGLLTLRLSPPAADYPETIDVARLSDRLLEKIRALPGVTSASTVSQLPLADDASVNTHVFEDFPPEPGTLPPFHPNRLVTTDYFETLGIPLLEGRTFEQRDLDQPRGAVIVSAALARHYWPDTSALGKRLRPETTQPGTWHTIVGVVGDTREHLTEPPSQSVYYPLRSRADEEGRDVRALKSLNLIIRTKLPPTQLIESIIATTRSMDRNISVSRVRPMTGIVADENAHLAFVTTLLLLAGLMAVGLGAVGLYAVVSFVVSHRTREFGIRMALGAGRGRVSRLVLRQGLLLALFGTTLGLLGGFALTRHLEALLFGVSPTDLLTFAATALVVMLVALFACYLPARRASNVDPVVALRHD